MKKKYLMTGGAGFIGSNLARYLLEKNVDVVVFDNFMTGKRENLTEIADRITLIEGDLRDAPAVTAALTGCDGVFHLGALGSVPRSIDDPVTSYNINVQGTFHLLEAMRTIGVRRVVFSSSSSVYGNQATETDSTGAGTAKVETMPVSPISPYAASKACCEAYMQAYAAAYGMETVSLRYFNVFGPRQDPHSTYAAVIPAFVSSFLNGKSPIVYGDGEQTRDFCYVENVCAANWLAMNAPAAVCDGSPNNIACHHPVSLNRILSELRRILNTNIEAKYVERRTGDIMHSLADIGRAKKTIGYEPLVQFDEGLAKSIQWYEGAIVNG